MNYLYSCKRIVLHFFNLQNYNSILYDADCGKVQEEEINFCMVLIDLDTVYYKI